MARRLILAATLLVCAGAWAQPDRSVQVPSLDAPHGTALVLPGHWFAAAAGAGAAPAMALMHGCGGVFDGRGWVAAADAAAELDDWTPATPCKTLSHDAQADPQSPAVQWESYAGAYHGFDGTAAVRLRLDVPGGAFAGQGVHVGGEPTARAAAALRLAQFLQDTWSLKR